VYGTEVFEGQKATAITAAGTTQIKAAPGKVARVVVMNVGTTATLDIYDHASSNSNKRVEWVTADGKVNWPLHIPMANGIRAVAGGTFGLAVIVWS
jgi:hypothetical protein